MSESQEIRAMRHMAWERAKGELRSMLQTFYGEDDRFCALDEEIDQFIDKVEGEELYE